VGSNRGSGRASGVTVREGRQAAARRRPRATAGRAVTSQ
jgi:hypothetical protein